MLDVKDPGDREVLDAPGRPGRRLRAEPRARCGRAARAGRRDAAGGAPPADHCSISGYGADGPTEQKKAYDLLVQCEAGCSRVTGTPESPAKVGISIADIAAGMYAYTGILTALYERERTGEGDSLEVAMLDALGEWMSQPLLLRRLRRSATAPHRCPARLHRALRAVRVADGTVFFGIQNDREWAVLCERILGPPDGGR